MPRASLSPQAIEEFLDATAWYEAQRPGLGTAFLEEFDRVIARLCEFPAAAPRVGRDLRIARVRRFAYSLIFRCRDGELRILAVFHVRSDPARIPDP